MSIFEFTLVLSGVDDKTPNLEDSLFEAKCDDALINFRNGTVYLDFAREAESLQDAVLSAINNVEKATQATVTSVSPDHLVSEAEIAKRINKGRQTVSLWAKRDRNKSTPFPSPILGLASKRPLWRWHEVVIWLYEKSLADEKLIEHAAFIEGVNSALLERDPSIKKIKNHALKSIKNRLH